MEIITLLCVLLIVIMLLIAVIVMAIGVLDLEDYAKQIIINWFKKRGDRNGEEDKPKRDY